MQLAIHAPDSVEARPWEPQAGWLIVVSGGILGLVVSFVLLTFVLQGPLSEHEYHLWRWEADTLTSNAFTRLGVGPGPAESGTLEPLERYFALTSQIRGEAESSEPDGNLLNALVSERAAYENDVERTVEAWVDEAVTEAGLQRRLPLFASVSITWPPVDIELTSPPQLLVRSPRDRIERAGDTLLKNDLTVGEIEAIEADTDSSETVSIVVSIGGIAAYPAIVRDNRTLDAIIETSAHEWVHHYLAFYPLGQTWGQGGDAHVLNETTAELAGREIATMIRARHPVELDDGMDGSAPARPAATVDFTAEMRELRLDVDQLLEQGRPEEAEALMEEKRLFLEEKGISIRKLNQAYFAFYGTYADSPQSSNPIGPKIERVWELTGDAGAFLRVMREVTSVRELDELIEGLEMPAAR